MINIGDIVNIIITEFFIVYNTLLIFAITILWTFFIFQFLNPNVSFPSVLDNGHLPSLNPVWLPAGNQLGYPAMAQVGMDFSVNLNIIVLNYIVAPVFSVMIILAGLSYLLRHTFQYGERIREYVPRIFFSVILSYFSVYIADIVMEIGRTIYSFFYSGLYIVWSGKPSPVYGLISLSTWPFNYFENFGITEYTTNGLLEYLVLLSLISVMLILLVVIVMRIVWIYFFIIALPVGSLFLMHPRTEEVGKRMWLSFIDRVFEICYMAPLLLLLNFIEDPIFWIAIFVVSLLIPYVVSLSLTHMGYPRTYTFFQGIGVFENSKRVGSTAFKSIYGKGGSNISLLPKNSGSDEQ